MKVESLSIYVTLRAALAGRHGLTVPSGRCAVRGTDLGMNQIQALCIHNSAQERPGPALPCEDVGCRLTRRGSAAVSRAVRLVEKHPLSYTFAADTIPAWVAPCGPCVRSCSVLRSCPGVPEGSTLLYDNCRPCDGNLEVPVGVNPPPVQGSLSASESEYPGGSGGVDLCRQGPRWGTDWLRWGIVSRHSGSPSRPFVPALCFAPVNVRLGLEVAKQDSPENGKLAALRTDRSRTSSTTCQGT
eukprot:1959646-Rhodomonas_salina.2